MSMQRACDFYLATDGSWYCRLGNYEYAYEDHQCTEYGPFTSEDAADKYVRDNFSNPGGSCTDDSGKAEPPEDPERPDNARSFKIRW